MSTPRLECDHPGCGRDFATSNALAIHKGRAHGAKLPTVRKPPPPAPGPAEGKAPAAGPVPASTAAAPVPHEHHDALVEAYLTIVIERLMLDGPEHADSIERLRRVKGLVCP